MALDWVATPLQWLLALPWLRFAYSALLIAIAAAVVMELARVWRPQPVQLGGFTYYVDGKADDGRAQGLRTQVRHHYQLLSLRLRTEAERRRAEVERQAGAQAEIAIWTENVGALGEASDRLTDLELTVQGVNVSKIGSSLRRAVTDPNEITGVFSRSKERHVSLVSWPKAPVSGGAGRTFPFASADTDDNLAFDIATAVLWTETASRPEVAHVSQAEFGDWARVMVPFLEIRDRAEMGHPPDPADAEVLRAGLKSLDALAANDVDFAEIYWLRASISRLLNQPGTPGDQQATEDLIVYNALRQGRSLTEARAAVQEASAPPKPPAATTYVKDFGGLLAEFESGTSVRTLDTAAGTAFATAADDTTGAATGAEEGLADLVAAVGFVRNRSGSTPYSGTGFVVGPKLVATATVVIGLDASSIGQLGPTQGIDFVLGDRVGSPGVASYAADRLVDVIGAPVLGTRLALLHVPDLPDIAAVPVAAAQEQEGASVGLIAFSGQDGLRQTSFGKLLRDESDGSVRYDAPTGPGSAGAPVLGQDGRALALHVGGSNDPGRQVGVGLSLSAAISPEIAAQHRITRR